MNRLLFRWVCLRKTRKELKEIKQLLLPYHFALGNLQFFSAEWKKMVSPKIAINW